MTIEKTTEPAGGCQCGAVRYRVTGGFGECGICHCRMCQRAVGNVFAPLITARGVIWEGEPARWASSNIAERGFCVTCGTPLFFRDFDDPEDEFEIMVGTLDDPGIAAADHHYGIESRVAWLKLADGLPEFVTGGRGGTDPEHIRSRQYATAGLREE